MGAPVLGAALLALGLAIPRPAHAQNDTGYVNITGSNSCSNNGLGTESCTTAIPQGPVTSILGIVENGAGTTLAQTVTGTNTALSPIGAPALLDQRSLGYTDESTDGPFTNQINGGNIDLTNQASLNWTLTANGEWTLFLESSQGGDGSSKTNGNVEGSIYNAGYGGTITVTDQGQTMITGAGYSGLPDAGLLFPYVTAYTLVGLGGTGTAAKANDTDYGGNGGNGGTLIYNGAAGSRIALAGGGGPGNAIDGILAYAAGGDPGCLCTGDHANLFGASGAGGAITINEAGSIVSTANDSNAIVAVSRGGAGGELPGNGVGNSGGGTSGPGGPITITLQNGGRIAMSGGNGIGIFAESSVGPSINDYATLAQLSGGAVSVTIDQGASLSSTGGTRFNLGVLAISSGTANLLAPFSDNTAQIGGTGYGGAVTIANAGTVTTDGELAIGLAALSVGGAGIVTGTDTGGISFLGSVSDNEAENQGGAVEVQNAGSITADGISAFGIAAISAGAGGIAAADQNAVFDDGILLQGVVLGGGGDAGAANPGGDVTVENSGTIATGDGNDGGKVAIGVLAQSIGGGGGTMGGSGAAAFIGDAGGSGGNGGAVTVQSNGGIATQDDGALGILAQSVGGGGGNGANAAGVFVAVGGDGGDGGDGGTVEVDLGSASTLATSGDFAAGVIEQSIGGGGGNGGYAVSGGVFISTAIGGAGGNGGAGGAVSFSNLGEVATGGQDSVGLIAQSVGGGGGNGGAANAYSVGVGLTAAIATGGVGGGGGNGGNVAIDNAGGIATLGPDASGLIAQSIGGGGGTGGTSVAKSLAIGTSEIPAVSFDLAIGGAGGDGGDGGTVTLDNAGQTITSGDGAAGLIAQSIGGGGGSAGDATATSDAFEGATQTLKIAVALGASGGGGGAGGGVTLTNGHSTNCPACIGYTSTGGDFAPGLLAQSIGGGGGNGSAGASSTGSPNVGGTTGTAVGLSFAAGGSGGGGGSGGSVTVSNIAGNAVKTTGSGSQGILAQSIGGGGGCAGGGAANGSGDNLDVNISLGGSGGAAGNGGDVTITNAAGIATGLSVLTNNGTFFTRGGDASGILAQSIGGGGGTAGSSDAAASLNAAAQAEDLINTPANSYSANIAIGGSGGTAGNGGTVSVGNSGAIATLGIRAYGIGAQSIGGGGGAGGAATSAANSVLGGGTVNGEGESVGNTYSATISVGGTGGASGDGGQVSVANTGASLFTAGYGADGILAQSVGGGGGVGAEGTANNTTSIGLGAGWNGGSGAGGNANLVTVNSGTITTLGDDALGILAQSISGGGGTASSACSNSASASLQGLTASRCVGNVGVTGNAAPWNDASDLSLSVGGGAGATGATGAANVTVDGDITTLGARAMGVVAQSIGGGGGYAAAGAINLGGTQAGDFSAANTAAGAKINVTLDQAARILTSGSGAWGILAQSVGGGGGFAGDASLALNTITANQLVRQADDSAAGGTVTLTIDGDIATRGANAHGIFAQSVGGTGGIMAGGGQSSGAVLIAGNTATLRGDDNNGSSGPGGAISITQGAGSRILAAGPGSIGIIAQSTGTAGEGSQIQLDLSGSVIGGTATGSDGGIGPAGLLVSGGNSAPNMDVVTVEPGATVGTVDGVSGTAILAVDSAPSVNNAGTITGSIDIGAGMLNAAAGGTLDAGATLTTASLLNAGNLAVAGLGRVGTTTVSGDFTNLASGNLAIDIDATGPQTADLLQVDGFLKSLGTVTPHALSLLPGTYTIATSPDMIEPIFSVLAGPLFDWTANVTQSAVTLTPAAAFSSAPNLTPDQRSAATYLQNAWNAADPALAASFARLANVASWQAAAQNFAALSARATQTGVTTLKNTESAVFDAPLSCPIFTDAGTMIGEDGCVWARVGGQVMDQYRTDDAPGFSATSNGYHIGGQKEFSPGWFLGAAAGAARIWSGMSNGSSSFGQVFDGSLALKREIGPFLFAGSLGLASGAYQNNRIVALPGLTESLSSDSRALLAGGRLRATYDFAWRSVYLRPILDLDLFDLDAPGYQESGSPDFALDVQGSNQIGFVAAPKLELGGRADLGRKNLILRYYADLGVALQPTDTQKIQASLLAAAPGEGSFTTTMNSPRTLGTLDLGLQLYRAGGFELEVNYASQVGGSYLAQGGSFRLAYHF